MRLFLSWTLLILFLAGAQTTAAQLVETPPGFGEVSYWTGGYVVNAPTQLMGFGTAFIPVRFGGWGIYADAKFTLESPADDRSFDPSLTPQEATSVLGDEHRAEDSEWTTVNLALVRSITSDFALYAGGGYSNDTRFQEYFDSDRERGRGGYYWVEDDRLSGARLNVLGGAFLRFGRRLVFQLGAESSPPGFTTGVAVALPFGG